MRFVVRTRQGNGRARTGLLHLSGGESQMAPIETPALLVGTRKGLPNFVSPDLFRRLSYPDSRLLHVSPLHFIERPPLKTISSIGGLHKMLGIRDFLFVAVPRDSIECLPASEATNKLGASFETPSGRLLVKPDAYINMISCLKPNLWASLADEVPAWVPEQRNKSSVERTLRWLDKCLSLDPEGGKTMLGAIVGGSDLEERKRCALEVASRNVSGYWIGGFGLGESMEERATLLRVVTDNLPEEKVRQVSGLGLPEEVLEGIAAGIDLFDSTYIYHLTIGGYALVFPLNDVEEHMVDSQLCDIGSDGTKINLRAVAYRKDTSPILDGCTCYTCQNHSRAYLNHLLNVHEMLVQTLLEIHNTHHYLAFFLMVREAIERQEFNEFYSKFVNRRRSLFTAT